MQFTYNLHDGTVPSNVHATFVYVCTDSSFKTTLSFDAI